jgi:uncharacterized Fe-S cluster-containing radical SAM superfamily protein
MMLDPIDKAEEIGKIVSKENQRKYYRFRPASFYGGIATADCVGCCLCCIFCWSYRIVTRPETTGKFYTPQQVASSLTGIAQKKRFRRIRISGNEPTLARNHLLEVLSLIPEKYLFILETNGILIGHDFSYAEELSKFPNLHVRVSIKGCTEEEFEELTGFDRKGFHYQLKAMANLLQAGVVCHPAAMVSFSPDEHLNALRKRLAEIHPDFKNIEAEALIPYPEVEKRLNMAGLTVK